MSAIPQRLKVADAVARRLAVQGALAVADLPRLVSALAADTGEIAVELAFEPDLLAAGRVRGALQGTLMLTCQRSLEAFAWPLHATLDWLLVGSDAEADKLLAEGDPVVLDHGEMALRDAIEDEVLLALPLIPLAPASTPGRKSAGKTKAAAMGDTIQLDDSRPNPFAALKGKFPTR